MIGEESIQWTVRIALVCYFAGIVQLLVATVSSPVSRMYRWIWTIGCAFFWLHVAAAFHFVHHWSHAAAFEHIAKQSSEVVGFAFGGGIYFNHAFMVVWLIDAAWQWISPQTWRTRPLAITALIHGYLAFIVVNATVVFKTGALRWVGLICCGIVVALSWKKFKSFAIQIRPDNNPA